MESLLQTLSADLFWDVDRDSVDPDKQARWLVERVLERGRWEDWLAIRHYYGKACLAALSPTLRVDAKSAHFLKLYCEL
jgi:squalene cyclase